MIALHKDVKALFKSLLSPNMVISKIQDLSLLDLRNKGYDTLLLDMDNTFVGRKSVSVSLSISKWIEEAKELNFSVYIVTNNVHKKRLERISTPLNISSLMDAKKPFVSNIQEMAYQYNIDFKQAVFVGDQLFTDVVSANLLGCFSVLTDPVEKKLQFIKTFQRDIEQYIRFKWLAA